MCGDQYPDQGQELNGIGEERVEQEDDKAGNEQDQRSCWSLLTGSRAVLQRAWYKHEGARTQSRRKFQK